MKVALSQYKTVWEDIQKNMEGCEKIISKAKSMGADLVGFPEFTMVGFTETPEKYCDKEGDMKQVDFFKAMSEKYHIAIVFGYIMDHEPHPLNKLAIVHEGKVLLDYAKIHSYSFGNENLFYDRGDEIFNCQFMGMDLGAHICFDLRFPEIFQVSSKKSDIIFVIGNWPADRIENWYTLLRARALETQCYIAGINRSGADGGIQYTNSSAAYDPAGKKVTEDSDSDLIMFEADKDFVKKIRESFPLKMDRREELYKKLYQ